MVRSMTAGMATVLAGRELRPINLVELLLDSGAIRLWTGIGDLSWDSKTWTGAGDLLSIGQVEETTEIRAVAQQFTLSGVALSNVSLVLNEEYQGRAVTMWFALLDDITGAVTGDPFIQFAGQADVMAHEDHGETSTILLTVEHRLAALARVNIRHYTPSDQQQDYPTDLGFDDTVNTSEEIIWGFV